MAVCVMETPAEAPAEKPAEKPADAPMEAPTEAPMEAPTSRVAVAAADALLMQVPEMGWPMIAHALSRGEIKREASKWLSQFFRAQLTTLVRKSPLLAWHRPEVY